MRYPLAAAACFVGDSAALDDAGYLQVFIQTHDGDLQFFKDKKNRRLSLRLNERELCLHSFLQSLASLEDRSLGSGHGELVTSAGIAGSTGCTILHFERAKTNELNLVALDQGIGYNIGESIQSLFGVTLVQTSFFSQSSNQFGLVHMEVSSSNFITLAG